MMTEQQREQSARPSEHPDGLTDEDGVTFWKDAEIITADYDPAADPIMERDFTYSEGARKDTKRWKAKTEPLGQFLAKLCRHQEGPKDGRGFVAAELAGDGRTAVGVKAIWAVGLDLDAGTPLKEISAAVQRLGVLAVVNTTHNHMTDRVEVKKDPLVKFADDRDYATSEVCRDYLREIKGYHPTIAESAEYVETVHGPDGIVAVISTAPIPKSRVIFPLAEPFIIENEGETQRDALERWRRIPAAVAGMMGVEIDKTGCDPNRFFYYPRHAPGAEFGAAIFGGPLLDWRGIDLPAAAGGDGTRKGPTTDAGRDLLRWVLDHASGFQVADAIEDHCPERKRGGRDIECPFDEEHSTNAGDPNDRACMAINAGEGTSSSRFVVSCRHDSCRERDNLDMLGKMLADGWFGREVLTDPMYNPMSGESEPLPAVGDYLAAIDVLTPDSLESDIENAIELVAKAGLAPIAQMKALGDVQSKTKLKVRVIDNTFKLAMKRVKSEAQSGHDDGVVTQPDGRRILHHRHDVPDHVDAHQFLEETITAANRSEPQFTSSLGAFMHMNRHGGRVSFEPLTPSSFRAQLSRLCSFVSITEDGEHAEYKRRPPHMDICTDLFHSLEPGAIPETPMIRRAPTIGADGSVLDKDGWRRDSNVYVSLGGLTLPPIPEKPSDEEIETAHNILMVEVLGDFRFFDKGDPTGAASRANAAAMLLTPFMRDLFTGPTPLFGAEKPDQKAGGSFLAKTPQILLDGKETAPTPCPSTEDEMSKVLVAAIQSGQAFLYFDNVKSLKSDVILKSVTAEYVGGRLLGLSQMIERINHFLWQFTGNNPKLNGEMRRRTVSMNLNTDAAANAEEPFTNADYVAWLKDNRARVIAALLTLIRAWVVAGKPAGSAEPLGSFEGWTTALSGLLDFAGIGGFLNNRPTRRVDRESVEIAEFGQDWFRKFGAEPATKVFEWARDIGSPMIGTAFDDAEKRAHFEDRLDGLNGRTFRVDGALLMLERDDDTGLWCMKKLRDLKPDAPE